MEVDITSGLNYQQVVLNVEDGSNTASWTIICPPDARPKVVSNVQALWKDLWRLLSRAFLRWFGFLPHWSELLTLKSCGLSLLTSLTSAHGIICEFDLESFENVTSSSWPSSSSSRSPVSVSQILTSLSADTDAMSFESCEKTTDDALSPCWSILCSSPVSVHIGPIHFSLEEVVKSSLDILERRRSVRCLFPGQRQEPKNTPGMAPVW